MSHMLLRGVSLSLGQEWPRPRTQTSATSSPGMVWAITTASIANGTWTRPSPTLHTFPSRLAPAFMDMTTLTSTEVCPILHLAARQHPPKDEDEKGASIQGHVRCKTSSIHPY